MAEKIHKKVIFWFRRDLRLTDNVGLCAALENSQEVIPVFIFDSDILKSLPQKDRRVDFIYQSLLSLKKLLNSFASDILISQGDPIVQIPLLAKNYQVDAVYSNEDYEPSAIARDKKVEQELKKQQVLFEQYKDTVIFAKNEVLNLSKKPYTVFTPYKNKWKDSLLQWHYLPAPSIENKEFLIKKTFHNFPTIETLGFIPTDLNLQGIYPGESGALQAWQEFKDNFIIKYSQERDYPSLDSTSHLSIHNRFGTISIRTLVREALELKKINFSNTIGIDSWLNELIWRDFYFQLLYHFPHVSHSPFKIEYKNLIWENSPKYFKAWCLGETGYPLIDAAMKQLNTTGFMHNRLRMVVASFLTKDLLCSYTLGESYFSEKLNDFDLAANNGGWQWAASTGCDAQPYFRVFNPSSQSEKFDKNGHFIKKWLPVFKNVPEKYLHAPWDYENELQQYGVIIGKNYPERIVVHHIQRDKIIDLFKNCKK